MNNHLFIGKVLIELDETESTNEVAKELIAKAKPIEGTAIIAQYQTNGKGQYHRTWLSAKGKNMTLSIILKPFFLPVSRVFALNMMISLAIVDLLKQFNIENIQIKWPNDILADKKKICGILIENTLRSSALATSVVGVGLNVNENEFDEELKNKAGSMKLMKGENFELIEVRELLFAAIEARYLKLKAGADFTQEYLNNIEGYNALSRFWIEKESKIVQASIISIEQSGSLVLRMNKGNIHAYRMGEIRQLLHGDT